MATNMQEDTPVRVEASATSGATLVEVEEHARILFQLLLEGNRQARENSRAMNAQMDQLNKRLDRLFYLVLGFGSASLVGLVAILIKLFLDG